MAFSNAQPEDEANIPISSVYRKEDNTFPALQAEPGGVLDSFSNQSSAAVMSFIRPLITQSAHSITGGASKTLNCPFTNKNLAGNSVIVCVGMGEVEGTNITLTITDTNNNSYTEAVRATQSTTLESAIFYATAIAGGANTVTVTIAGSSSTTTAIAVEIYEVAGLVGLAGSLDQTATGSNANSNAPATSAINPVVPNELCFAAIISGGGTITAGTGFNLDSGNLTPAGGGVGSFASQSQALTSIASLTPSASLSVSTTWAMATATFRSITVPIEGTVNVTGSVSVSNFPSTQTVNGSINVNTISNYAQETGGNLATLAGIVSSNKAAVKAASGDFADGSLATLGAKTDTAITDSTTTNSGMSFTKGLVKIFADIWDSVNHRFGVADIEAAGYVAASGTPPSATNAGSDTTYTFSSQVNRIVLQNNTSASVNFDFDQAASAGSFLCLPGTLIIYPKKCTALHLYTASTQNINGSSTGNIVVRGAL